MRLDDKDEVLLLALERNARASVVDLARRIGLSRSATQERLARLERIGAILRYTIDRGASSSRSRLLAWLMVHHSSQGNCARAVPRLHRIPEVTAVHGLAGKPDLLVQVSAADAADLDRLGAEIRMIPGVEQVSTHLVLATHFDRRAPGEEDRVSIHSPDSAGTS